MKTVIILMLCTLLCGCAYNRNFIARRSDLRNFVAARQTDDQVRAKLLELTPIGSSKLAVETVVRGQFRRGVRKEPDLPEQFTKMPGAMSSICVRLFESGTIPIGSNWTEALWFFNEDDVLIEIVVGQYGVWL